MNTLRNRMILWVWGSVLLLLILMLAVDLYSIRRSAVERLTVTAANHVRYYSQRLQAQLAIATSTATVLARGFERYPNAPQAEIEKVVAELLTHNGQISIITVASRMPPLTSFSYSWHGHLAQSIPPVLGRWWEVMQKDPRPSWTISPVNEPPMGVVALRYAAPFYASKGMRGAVAVEVSLEDLRSQLHDLQREGAAYGFLVSSSGEMLALPGMSNASPHPTETADPELVRALSSGKPGFMEARDPMQGRACWIAYEPVGDTGVSVAIVYLARTEWDSLYRTEMDTLLLALAGGVVLLLLVTLLANSISGPISELAASSQRVAQGDFNFELKEPRAATQEVKELSASFAAMLHELRSRLAQLEETAKERERVASQLRIGSDIQASILPRRFPRGRTFEVYAETRPALEVGGDFYDFFQIDDNRYGLLVGDVSGKGVPAGIYMAAVATLLRLVARSGVSPSTCLSWVNRELCHDESGLFCTIVYAVLEPEGQLTYASAGHHLPLLLRGSQVVQLDSCEGLVIGVMEDASFSEGQTHLQPGDRLLFYTDGVNEAQNGARELYGDERLVARLDRLLQEDPQAGAHRLVQIVIEDVQAFAGDTPLGDDLTMLSVHFQG